MNWEECVPQMLAAPLMEAWRRLTARVDDLYDVDRLWDKGFGCWKVEYKYRRGGKTLCTLYAREGEAKLLITLGKAEREKFAQRRETFSVSTQQQFDATPILHDGMWMWISIDDTLDLNDVEGLLKIKRRPNRK